MEYLGTVMELDVRGRGGGGKREEGCGKGVGGDNERVVGEKIPLYKGI